MADKLLSALKRLIRYIALYLMAGVAMENRLFRIHPNARDTPFMDACAAYLKMSQVKSCRVGAIYAGSRSPQEIN